MIPKTELPTIVGADYGFSGASRYLGYGLPDRYCAFISEDEDGAFLNVWLSMDPEDMDSTDHNPFRQYTIRADMLARNAQASSDPVLHALEVCWDLCDCMGRMEPHQLDRLLVTSLKMSRAI